MAEVCLALALVVFGFVCGWKCAKATVRPPLPPTQEERELQRLQEDRAAFATLMGYNVRTAYGETDTE